MAKDSPQKPKPEKKQKANKKKLDISAVAFIDNMVFSKTEAWAYYKVTNQAFDFLTAEGQANLVQRLTNSFNVLMSDRQESLDLHLIVTSVPVDIDLWQAQVFELSSHWERSPGFEQYMAEVTDFLKDSAYFSKIVYLGVNLGKRGALNLDELNVFDVGLRGALDVAKEWFNKSLSIPTQEVAASEEESFRRREETIHRNLSVSHLRASRATAEELLLLIKRQMYPSMPAPYLDVDHGSRLGPGDLALETASAIENRYRWLRIRQMIGSTEFEGYRATLSMSKFPKEMAIPGSWPFFYYIQKMGLPFTAFARVSLHPSKKMKAEVEKKKKEQRDELENLSGAVDSVDMAMAGMPDHVADAIYDQQLISRMLTEDKAAWVEGSYFIVVETPTEETLRKYVAALKQAYTDLDVNISWTAGDQTELFLAQMPGDRHRMKSFDQVTSLSMLAASGFNFSSEVGDPIYGKEDEAVTNG